MDPEVSSRAFRRLQEVGSRPGNAIQVSSYVYSPAGMTGVETISHELAEQSEGTIDHVFCPAGGGGLALAVTRGFRMLVDRGDLDRSPAVEVVQPEGNNTMAGPLREGAECAREVESTTRISGMQVPNINDGHMVVEECRPTAGTGHLVTDEEVWAIQERLAREEGIFSEPAGAVALAGALNAVADGTVDAKARIVCVVTGSGFKDPEAVDRMLEGVGCPTVDLEAFVREVGRA